MEAVLHKEVMAEIMDDNMGTVLRTKREVVEDSLKSRLEDTVKNRMEDTVKVPGFGFLDRQLWAGLEPLRRVSRAFPTISFSKFHYGNANSFLWKTVLDPLYQSHAQMHLWLIDF